MRKVLSFVLVLSLVLGSFSMAFAATPADVVGEASEEAVSVLSDLGVVSGYEDGTYRPENIVTRAEMAVLIIRALGLTDYVTTAAKSSFSDMAGYGWAEGYVAYAQSLGFVSGYPDGTFKPGRTVSYDEAASMLVRALGYTPESLVGTWPANFIVKAKALGILDDIQAGAAGANRGDVAIMLYQTLDQTIGQVNKDGEFKPTAGDSMLVRLGATEQPAKVITFADRNSAKIDINKYVGAYAVTYTKSNKIVAVGEVKSVFLDGEIIAGDKIKADGVTYTNVTEDALSVTPTALHFANGVADGNAAAADLGVGYAKLAVKLSGKTIEAIYSVAEWTLAETFQYEKDMLDDKYIGTYAFTLKDGKIDTTSFGLFGVGSLADIDEDNVVTVYLDGITTGKITKIEVGTDTAKGQVSRVTSDGDVVIDGTTYALNIASGSAPQLAETGTAYLDYNGEVAFWDADSSTAGNYAVLLGTKAAVSAGITEKAKIQLFTKDGNKTIFDAKNATVAAVVSAAAVDTLVKYSVDKKGEIDSIELLGDAGLGAGEFNKAGTIFEGNAVAANAVVFVKDGSSYSLGTLASVDKESSMTLVKASFDGKSRIQVFTVLKTDTGNVDSVYAVVNAVDAKLNADGDKVQYVTGFVGGKEYNAYTDSASKVGYVTSSGLVQFTVDSDGVITATPALDVFASMPGVTVSAIDGKLVQVTGGALAADTWISLDNSIVVYAYNATDDKWEVKTVSYLRNKLVTFYKVDKDSSVYDIAVIQ